MLRVLAMLVLNVAATLQMIRRRGPVIGTQTMPSALPRETHDTLKEQHAVQQDSHTSPSPSVSLTTSAIHLPLLRRWRTFPALSSTAEGGGGGSLTKSARWRGMGRCGSQW